MSTKNFLKNPWFLFLPLLIVYIVIVFLFKTNGTYGDEPRYINYAKNLINGFYSPPPPDIDLGNGPGYSLILVPLVALNLPLVSITILNAAFYYMSIVLLFKTMRKSFSFRLTMIFSLFWAFYINALENLPSIVSETLTVFLVVLVLFFLTKAFEDKQLKSKIKYLVFAGCSLGYLAITKPIFGYVLIFMLSGSIILWLINNKDVNLAKSVIILMISLATTLPYLVYTYNLTGKFFYWSSFGGDNLYWMTTPYKGEHGNWFSFKVNDNDTTLTEKLIPDSWKIIEKNHDHDYKEYMSYSSTVERDDALKRMAINNIRSNPLKFLQNCISNIGRILFNFPYTYQLQSPNTLVRLPFNGFIVVFAVLSLIPTIINWRRIPFEMKFYLLFVLLYLGGSILGSAETRMFTVVVPLLLTWIAYILSKTVSINLRIE